MFRGHYVHTIDAKGRVSLPARFREKVPTVDGVARVVIAPDPFGEACLHLYPETAWEEIEAKIAELPRFAPHAARFRRRFVSAAEEHELDRSGRLLVSPRLRERAKLEKEVLFAGSISKIEIWAKESWDAEVALSADDEAAYRQAVSEWI